MFRVAFGGMLTVWAVYIMFNVFRDFPNPYYPPDAVLGDAFIAFFLAAAGPILILSGIRRIRNAVIEKATPHGHGSPAPEPLSPTRMRSARREIIERVVIELVVSVIAGVVVLLIEKRFFP